MRSHDEIVADIKIMEGVGFRASEQDSLPLLFSEVYGFELGKCADCKTKAYNALVKWANKKTKVNTNMAFQIKKQYKDVNFPVRVGGVLININSVNLTDERAKIMLSIPKYAHAIEGQPDREEEAFETVGDFESIVKKKSIASISEEAQTGGKTLKVKKGKLVKS